MHSADSLRKPLLVETLQGAESGSRPTRRAARTSRLDRKDAIAVGALMTIAVAIPLWMAVAAGTIGIPAADDWVYMQGADSLYRTGTVHMAGHTAASIGQLVLVQPLLWLSAGAPWAYTAFGLLLAAVGVIATYLLARRFVATGAAVMAVLLILAFPGFARETATFMTDIPTYALIVLCLLEGTRWLQGDGGRRTLIVSVVIGLLAVMVREFALAAPVAILVTSWFHVDGEQRPFVARLSAVFAICVAGELVLSASVPGGGQPYSADVGGLFLIGPVFATLAAALLPVVVLWLLPRLATFRAEEVLLGAGTACLALAVPWGLHRGDLWMPNGLAGDLLLNGARDAVIGGAAWAMSRQLALLATILLASVIVSVFRQALAGALLIRGANASMAWIAVRPDSLLVLFVLAYAAELVIVAPAYIYDRYLFPIVPVVAILLLRGSPPPFRFGRTQAVAHGALAWLAISAALIAANSFAYDAARWRAGEAATRMGYTAQTVDAGYEWVGYHGGDHVGSSAPASDMTWNGDRWALIHPCAVVSNSLPEGDAWTLTNTYPASYMQYLFFGRFERLYLYVASTDGCPTSPSARR